MDSVLIKPAQSIKIPYHALISSNGILRTAITTLLVATHLIKNLPRAMINKTYLFEKLLSYCDNIQGVDEQVLDAHLQKHDLTIRPDHRSFLLKYGNSNQLLKSDYGDSTYAMFEEYTSNPQEYMSGFDELPDGTVFLVKNFLKSNCVSKMNQGSYIHMIQKSYWTIMVRVLMHCYFLGWLYAYQNMA